MKYPPLVPMPTSVQDWLDAQLEARGIDAVAYTRYIFNVLQRETHDFNQPVTISPHVSKKCGIERLVADLCAKLQEDECNAQLDMPSQSLHDQAQKYYAAFPPLGKKPAEAPSAAAVWASQSDGNHPENVDTAWTMSDSYDELASLEGNDMTQRRLYLRQPDSPGCPDDGELPKRTLDDKNLAQLIAKFDESIEALWSPAEENPLSESDCVQELPVDIQQLLASPSDCGESKHGSGVNSFIPCGTNITCSIWSDCTDDSNAEPAVELDHDIANNNSLFQNMTNSRGEHGEMKTDLRSNIEWNKSEISPSLYTSLPFGLSYALGDLTQNITSNQKWSDFQCSGFLGRYLSSEENLTEETCNAFRRSTQPLTGLSTDFVDGGFVALNHNKEDSSFTEVIPKINIDGLPTALDMMTECVKTQKEKPEAENEDEDLLTSTRTHFKPIKQESNSQSGSIRGYPDGTTFVIPNGLEVLPFKRCQSGTLYLESEARPNTPAKYREYKEKEPYGGRCMTMDIGKEFIPKFKVCPNEKFCQTDEEGITLQSIASSDAINFKSIVEVTHQLEKTSDFFFPGDDQLASNITNCANDDDDERMYEDYHEAKKSQVSRAWVDELCQCNNNNNNVLSWKAGSDIWSDNSCRSCETAACGYKPVPAWDVQHDRLREELTQDGEQLLSDLSYMQHLFLGSDWLEENTEQPMADWIDEEEEGNRPSAQKFQCISPMSAIAGDQELIMYVDDASGSHSLPGKHLAKDNVVRFEAKSVDDFFSNCLLNVLPKTILLSVELEAKWKQNERPFNSKVNPKDRKRRHSVSQRAVPRDTVVTRSQTSCVNGIACPQFVLNHARDLRPVTL